MLHFHQHRIAQPSMDNPVRAAWVTPSLYAPAWDHHGNSFKPAINAGNMLTTTSFSGHQAFSDVDMGQTATHFGLLPSPSVIRASAGNETACNFTLSHCMLSDLPKLQSVTSTLSNAYSSVPGTPVSFKPTPVQPVMSPKERLALDINLPPCSPPHSPFQV